MPATSRRTYTWNAYESVLSSGIDGSTTTITLDSVVGLREPDGYLVLDPDDAAKREFIKYASIVGNTLQGCTRGLADRKSTRLNSSHTVISYAVFCLKKKKNKIKKKKKIRMYTDNIH